MYALVTPMFSSGTISCTKRIFDNAIIPFAPDNTDYVQFKIDVANGNELQDSEGVVMSPEAAQAFIATLP